MRTYNLNVKCGDFHISCRFNSVQLYLHSLCVKLRATKDAIVAGKNSLWRGRNREQDQARMGERSSWWMAERKRRRWRERKKERRTDTCNMHALVIYSWTCGRRRDLLDSNCHISGWTWMAPLPPALTRLLLWQRGGRRKRNTSAQLLVNSNRQQRGSITVQSISQRPLKTNAAEVPKPRRDGDSLFL